MSFCYFDVDSYKHCKAGQFLKVTLIEVWPGGFTYWPGSPKMALCMYVLFLVSFAFPRTENN